MTNQCRRCGKPTEAWGQVTEISRMSAAGAAGTARSAGAGSTRVARAASLTETAPATETASR